MSDLLYEAVIKDVLNKEFLDKVKANIDFDKLAKDTAVEIQKNIKSAIKDMGIDWFEDELYDFMQEIDLTPFKQKINKAIKESLAK